MTTKEEILERLAAMPSSLNDALRTMDEAAEFIRSGVPQSPDQWRPIETAPSDGREVLVHTVWPVVRVRVTQADGEWWRRGKQEGVRSIPTRWMPLPQGPDTRQDRADQKLGDNK